MDKILQEYDMLFSIPFSFGEESRCIQSDFNLGKTVRRIPPIKRHIRSERLHVINSTLNKHNVLLNWKQNLRKPV